LKRALKFRFLGCPMQYQNVSILSLAHIDAPHRVTSSELSQQFAQTLGRLGVGLEVLEYASGIEARRYWDNGVQPSEAAALAGEKALLDSGIDRSRIGIIVNTSVCRDYIEPSTACLVHQRLGLSTECLNFDLGNACLGFLSGMQVVSNMIERGQVDYALVVDGESARFVQEATIARLQRPETTLQEFTEQFATLTLGSGSVAMVLARTDLVSGGHRFTGVVNRAATQHSGLCRGQPDHMVTDAKALLVAGIELASQTYDYAKTDFGWIKNGVDQVDEYVLHQVSGTHTASLCKALGLDTQKVLAIYPEFGNIGPASVPIVLSKAAESGRLKKGSRVALMGIGSGLNCSMAEIIW
jgi:3-oxoacyl-[acyl-carrier-protein] synthase-3